MIALANPKAIEATFAERTMKDNSNNLLQVTLLPHASQHVSFTPHPDHDATNCDEGLEALAQRIEKNGYYGGIRLLMVSSWYAAQHTITSMV